MYKVFITQSAAETKGLQWCYIEGLHRGVTYGVTRVVLQTEVSLWYYTKEFWYHGLYKCILLLHL